MTADFDARCGLSGKVPFNHLMHPVPVSGAPGIHATLAEKFVGALQFNS